MQTLIQGTRGTLASLPTHYLKTYPQTRVQIEKLQSVILVVSSELRSRFAPISFFRNCVKRIWTCSIGTVYTSPCSNLELVRCRSVSGSRERRCSGDFWSWCFLVYWIWYKKFIQGPYRIISPSFFSLVWWRVLDLRGETCRMFLSLEAGTLIFRLRVPRSRIWLSDLRSLFTAIESRFQYR